MACTTEPQDDKDAPLLDKLVQLINKMAATPVKTAPP